MENLQEEGGDVFFLRRGDGFIFACGEREAWNTLRNASNWQRRDFTVLGTSDGSTYKKVMSQSRQERQEITAKIAEAKKKIERFTATEEKLLFEELLPEDDAKVLRAKELKDQAITEFEKETERLQNLNSDIVQRAFDAELEVAKQSPRLPQNHDIETPGLSKDRDEVLSAMGKRARR